jgi:hypothetical protein
MSAKESQTEQSGDRSTEKSPRDVFDAACKSTDVEAEQAKQEDQRQQLIADLKNKCSCEADAYVRGMLGKDALADFPADIIRTARRRPHGALWAVSSKTFRRERP